MSLFSAKWATKNKLTNWLAFELEEPVNKDHRKKRFHQMFGERKNPHPTSKSVDRIQSRIVVECHKPVGKLSLRRSATKEGQRYFVQAGID